MTRYLHADITQVARSEFSVYIREFDYWVHGSTKALAEYEAYRAVEEIEGLRAVTIIFSEA